MMMSFLGSIGKFTRGASLSDALLCSALLCTIIYGTNAVEHMMSGKVVSRAIRGHFLEMMVSSLSMTMLLQNRKSRI